VAGPDRRRVDVPAPLAIQQGAAFESDTRKSVLIIKSSILELGCAPWRGVLAFGRLTFAWRAVRCGRRERADPVHR